jgi:glyoxylase-like metal-dependent hydrolase (beta-lactamase superfamily II)
VTVVTPVVDAGLGNTSWMVDLGDGRLAVIDPGRHPGPFRSRCGTARRPGLYRSEAGVSGAATVRQLIEALGG